tara:strand:+ start:1971 stop:2834 length:864 start_codon:yes stop_codon:yes gene_type:complete
MTKKISYIIYRLLKMMDNILRFFVNRSFLIYFKDFIEDNAYKKINILNTKTSFFIPNRLVEWRVDTFFTKEPETLEWIDGFEKKDNLIFWDIGANIGLYSIYNVIKNKNSVSISFEPSSSNLRVLTRNISINRLEDNIKVFPLPLTNKVNQFQIMNESDFVEGGSLNSFGEKFNFEGEIFENKMNYQIYGTSINYLIKNNILEIPDYIKIDVDGIEHFILEGASKYLENKKIKSLSIEINENFKEQYEKVIEIMKKNNFKVLHKKHNKDLIPTESKYSKIFNYIFIR